jgi:hypothetical protein
MSKKTDFLIEEITPNTKRNCSVGKNFKIPSHNSYEDLILYNYKTEQLKEICSVYNLRKTGNKSLMVNRIYNFLKYGSYATKLQRVSRGFIQRNFNKNSGPALFNKSLCINDSDFLSMEPLAEIKYPQFYSIKDSDKFVYGFDVISLYNLLIKDGTNATNPYTRSEMPSNLLKQLKTHIKISKLLCKDPIKIEIQNDMEHLSGEKQMELKALDLFQHINSLGNYADQSWYMNMNRMNIIIFMRELFDVWTYRSQITNDTRHMIYPLGNPFIHINTHDMGNHSTMNLKKMGIVLIENLTTKGINTDSQSLGAFYVLGALTLVNSEARNSLPWLYQSFLH